MTKSRSLAYATECVKRETAGGPVYSEPPMTVHKVADKAPPIEPAPDPHGFRRQLAYANHR